MASYCQEKYGSLTIPQMLKMIEERDYKVMELEKENKELRDDLNAEIQFGSTP